MNLRIWNEGQQAQARLLKVDLGKEDMIGHTLKILDCLGRMVYEMLITQQVFQLDLSLLNGKGIFFLEVVDSCSQILEVDKISFH